jgi:hypothetical protein
MPHEVVDETNGPGTVHSRHLDNTLKEIWLALEKGDHRTPTLDEVLVEIRGLVAFRTLCVQNEMAEMGMPEMPDDEDPARTFGLSSVFYPDGMTIAGFSSDDVLKIRSAALAEKSR